MKKQDREDMLAALEEAYGSYACGLTFQSPFQLLIATMLSAQCTDVRVNIVTQTLFPAFPDAASLAALTPEELEPWIKTCGLYHSKAKNIVAACKELVVRYGGQVPTAREALEALPGVGRKTANVVLSNAFGEAAIAVDTHVFRVAGRMGLSGAKNVRATEEALMRAIPKDKWSSAHHWLIWHGRLICAARAPKCGECPVALWCQAYKKGAVPRAKSVGSAAKRAAQ